MSLRPADNPFRVERVHSLDYAPQGLTWAQLLTRLERLRLRAAIVGPHGTGKTTLLRALVPRLEAQGLRPRLLFRNAEGGGAIPAPWLPTLADIGATDILLVDGYDHLSPLARLRLRRVTRRAAGLVVTTHRRGTLPMLVRTTASPDLLQMVVIHLAGQPLPPHDAAVLLHRHHGNLREALWELYDRAALLSSRASGMPPVLSEPEA